MDFFNRAKYKVAIHKEAKASRKKKKLKISTKKTSFHLSALEIISSRRMAPILLSSF
jgi:hypothetical protein